MVKVCAPNNLLLIFFCSNALLRPNEQELRIPSLVNLAGFGYGLEPFLSTVKDQL